MLYLCCVRMQNCGGRPPTTLLVLRTCSLMGIIQEDYRAAQRVVRSAAKTKEFTQLSQKERTVTTYIENFPNESVLPRVGKHRLRVVLELDTKIRKTVEAIVPTTYAAALRAAKAMEGPESLREPPSSSVGQK